MNRPNLTDSTQDRDRRAHRSGKCAAWLICAAALACGLTRRAQMVDARRVREDVCAPGAAERAEAFLRSWPVTACAPLMAYVGTGGSRSVGSFLTLVGARVEAAADAGETPEALQRSLRCHEALRVLGGAEEAGRDLDPLWNPGGRLRIDVHRGHDGYVVELRSEPLALADAVHDRACGWARHATDR